ncbi:MAG: hypothetical protein NY202_01285 [Mollicutes bacterium UO1]
MTALQAKLKKITRPDPDQEKPDQPQIPKPTTQEEAEKYGADYANLKPPQQEGRQKIVEN